MKTKPFDCVEMKRQAAAKIYERIKTMTIEEELRFWNVASDGLEKTEVELRERAERGSWGKFQQVLEKVPDVEPEPYDAL